MNSAYYTAIGIDVSDRKSRICDRGLGEVGKWEKGGLRLD